MNQSDELAHSLHQMEQHEAVNVITDPLRMC